MREINRYMHRADSYNILQELKRTDFKINMRYMGIFLHIGVHKTGKATYTSVQADRDTIGVQFDLVQVYLVQWAN